MLGSDDASILTKQCVREENRKINKLLCDEQLLIFQNVAVALKPLFFVDLLIMKLLGEIAAPHILQSHPAHHGWQPMWLPVPDSKTFSLLWPCRLEFPVVLLDVPKTHYLFELPNAMDHAQSFLPQEWVSDKTCCSSVGRFAPQYQLGKGDHLPQQFQKPDLSFYIIYKSFKAFPPLF